MKEQLSQTGNGRRKSIWRKGGGDGGEMECWVRGRRRRRLGCHNLEGIPGRSRGWKSPHCHSWPSTPLGPLWGVQPHALKVHIWRRFQRGFWGATEAWPQGREMTSPSQKTFGRMTWMKMRVCSWRTTSGFWCWKWLWCFQPENQGLEVDRKQSPAPGGTSGPGPAVGMGRCTWARRRRCGPLWTIPTGHVLHSHRTRDYHWGGGTGYRGCLSLPGLAAQTGNCWRGIGWSDDRGHGKLYDGPAWHGCHG